MITPSSSQPLFPGPGSLDKGLPAGPPRAHVRSGVDTLSTHQAQRVQAALAREPAIRPEVMARAASLAADPSYPPRNVIDQVARLIVRSPDPAELA